MGAKPLFAMDSMQVKDVEQSEKVSLALKKQSDGLGVPIIGGNTQMEKGLTPCISFTVVGEMQSKKIIPDSGSRPGDQMIMLGEPVEGETGQRVRRANVKFETFLEIIKKVDLHAAKDASRGGWFGNLIEMLIKARAGFDISAIPYPQFARYLGTYMITFAPKDEAKILEIAAEHGCMTIPMGTVLKEPKVMMGKKTLVGKRELQKLHRGGKYKKPYRQKSKD
jgi:selenophosphate synthetase-related protein